MKTNHRNKRLSSYVIHSFFMVYCILAMVPLILILAISFSNENDIFQNGYKLIPQHFNLNAYAYLFTGNKTVINAYVVTIVVTIIGTGIHLIISSMLAYAISRNELKYRNQISFAVMFCLLFSGGLVPTYILIARTLHMRNSIAAIIFPSLLSAVYVLIMRNFFKTLPDAMVESARIDGSGEFNTFLKIIVPLSTPAFATIGLFVSVYIWNDWYNCALYIDDVRKFTLQYLLQTIMNNIAYLQGNTMTAGAAAAIPNETARMATCVLALGPIVFTYPLLQKYFVKGLTLGAVKS